MNINPESKLLRVLRVDFFWGVGAAGRGAHFSSICFGHFQFTFLRVALCEDNLAKYRIEEQRPQMALNVIKSMKGDIQRDTQAMNCHHIAGKGSCLSLKDWRNINCHPTSVPAEDVRIRFQATLRLLIVITLPGKGNCWSLKD